MQNENDGRISFKVQAIMDQTKEIVMVKHRQTAKLVLYVFIAFSTINDYTGTAGEPFLKIHNISDTIYILLFFSKTYSLERETKKESQFNPYRKGYDQRVDEDQMSLKRLNGSRQEERGIEAINWRKQTDDDAKWK